MILTAGTEQDFCLEHLHAYLDQYEVPYFFLSQEALGQRADINQDNISLDAGETISLDKITGVYTRFGPYDSENTDYDRQIKQYEVFRSVIENLDCPVVAPLYIANSNASKPYQLIYYDFKALKTPETILVSRYPVNAELSANYPISKSVSSIRSKTEFIYSDESTEISNIIQLQDYIEGEVIRVHVIGDELYSLGIKSDNVDSRYSKEVAYFSLDLPETVKEDCFAVNRKNNILFSGIDLIRQNDEYYFLEANTSPGYCHFEQVMDEALITRSLINLLTTGVKQ